jgi:hypothetical protein
MQRHDLQIRKRKALGLTDAEFLPELIPQEVAHGASRACVSGGLLDGPLHHVVNLSGGCIDLTGSPTRSDPIHPKPVKGLVNGWIEQNGCGLASAILLEPSQKCCRTNVSGLGFTTCDL